MGCRCVGTRSLSRRVRPSGARRSRRQATASRHATELRSDWRPGRVHRTTPHVSRRLAVSARRAQDHVLATSSGGRRSESSRFGSGLRWDVDTRGSRTASPLGDESRDAERPCGDQCAGQGRRRFGGRSARLGDAAARRPYTNPQSLAAGRKSDNSRMGAWPHTEDLPLGAAARLFYVIVGQSMRRASRQCCGHADNRRASCVRILPAPSCEIRILAADTRPESPRTCPSHPPRM